MMEKISGAVMRSVPSSLSVSSDQWRAREQRSVSQTGEKKLQPLPRLLCPFLARFKGPSLHTMSESSRQNIFFKP